MLIGKPNHLLGYRRRLLKLEFVNVQDLLAVRKEIMPIAERNRKKLTALDTYAEVARLVARASFGVGLMEAVRTPGLICLTSKTTIDDRMRLWTRAISSSTFESTMSRTTFGWPSTKVRTP